MGRTINTGQKVRASHLLWVQWPLYNWHVPWRNARTMSVELVQRREISSYRIWEFQAQETPATFALWVWFLHPSAVHSGTKPSSSWVAAWTAYGWAQRLLQSRKMPAAAYGWAMFLSWADWCQWGLWAQRWLKQQAPECMMPRAHETVSNPWKGINFF